jgi:ABC-2 type transport system permease protein
VASGGVYWQLLRAQVRAQASYRASFAIDVIGNVLVLGADILAVVILFRVTPTLGGFSISEVLLMVGLSSTAFSLADLAVGNVEKLRLYVRTGLLDAVLVRPLRLLPQLLVLDFGTRRIGRVLYSLVFLAVVLANVDIAWTPGRVALVVLAPLTGATLFSCIFVASASVAFWWIDTGELANAVTYGGRDFTAYPLNVYSGWFQKVFGYGLGFGFVAYYPALYLLGRPDPLGLPAAAGWASPAVALLAIGVAALIWRTGVRQYRSTGS